MRRILIAGAGTGLGNSLIDGIAEDGDHFYLSSKSAPVSEYSSGNSRREWVEADLSDPANVSRLTAMVGRSPLDVLIYNAGIWETGAFEHVPATDIQAILNVNLTSAILLVQKLLNNLREGKLRKIIFIGSTCGLENEGGDAVAYAASKFGMRGLTHALREYVRKDGIAVSCISPGSIASDVHFREGTDAALQKYNGRRLPVSDIVSVIRLILQTSNASCIKEVHIPALPDRDV